MVSMLIPNVMFADFLPIDPLHDRMASLDTGRLRMELKRAIQRLAICRVFRSKTTLFKDG